MSIAECRLPNGRSASRQPAKPELLAPAGGWDSACAALHYGADAVYAGLPRFSARSDAENFSWASLGELVAYAHGLAPRRRVYVAFNTLVLDRELAEAAAVLQRIAELGVDAVIVQDLGVARLAREHFPALRLHASTQAAVHSVEGARALGRLGFSRVVLARELSLAETAALARDSGLEVETFIHGALCYSYSGLCLFSSHATGRSGNRGRCASCCRETFRAGAGEGLAFSMKDLALGRRIAELRDTGTRALKIEGRLKGPLYVAAVTDYYRKLLDGRTTEAERKELEENLHTIFSRPWTELYAGGDTPREPVIDVQTVGHRGARIGAVERVRRERDGDWLTFRSTRALERHDGLQVDLAGQPRPFGFAVDALRGSGVSSDRIRTAAGETVAVRLPPDHPILPSGAPVYCSSSQAVKRSYDFTQPRPGSFRVRHPLTVQARLEAAGLAVEGVARIPGLGDVTASASIPGPFAPARTPGGTEVALRKAFERLGDTDWEAAQLSLQDAAGLFAPASAWNEVRRLLAIALDGQRESLRARRLAELLAPEAPVPCETAETWSVKLDDAPGDWAEEADEIVLPLDASPAVADARLRVALPLILRPPRLAEVRDRVRERLRAGVRRWEVSSLAGLEVLRDESEKAGQPFGEIDVTADWSIYTLNGLARQSAAGLGLTRCVTSPEEDRENLLERLRTASPATLLLAFQYTPLFLSETAPALADAHLRGRRGERYAELVQDGLHVLIAERPFSLAGHLPELLAAGARHFRADFSRAAAAGAEPEDLWRRLRAGEMAGSHDANYGRGLL